jgi:hypothetical protein
VANRIDKTAAGNPSLTCLSVLGADRKPIAGLVVFNAHPTCYGHDNRKISGDYPGRVQRGLAERFGGVWLFAAGAVGSMSPAWDKPRGPECLADTSGKVFSAASSLAARALASGPAPGPSESASVGDPPSNRSSLRQADIRYLGPARPEATLVAEVLTVDLPERQYRISQRWRLSPVITSLVHARESYIHVVRINELVLLGMPCDYSGELSARLEGRWMKNAAADTNALLPVCTSFNGDYIGYLIPHERYAADNYESLGVNFFGPWCGEYFHNLSVRIVERLAEAAGQAGRP